MATTTETSTSDRGAPRGAPMGDDSSRQRRRSSADHQPENRRGSLSRMLMQQAPLPPPSGGASVGTFDTMESSIAEYSVRGSSHTQRSSSRGLTRRSSRRMSRRMSNPNHKRGLVKLDFTHLPLYGRFQEKLSIVNSMGRIATGKGEVILLYGKGGTGKTSLVNESLQDYQQSVTKKNINGTNGSVSNSNTNKCAHFLGRGKFEQSKLSNKPFAAVVEVFSNLIDSMINQMGKDGEDYASSVEDALGDEAYRITTLIPTLVSLIGERPANENQEQAECDLTTFRRLLNLLRSMLRAICAFQRPVVLFFDDLHYADSDSLAVFKYLANDSQATNLLVIGAYEDTGEEIAMDKAMTILEEIDQVKTTLIRLDNLSEDNINHMLSDVMEMEKDLTKKLARTVYKTTMGNAFFVINFLELISELGFLQLEVESKQWLWDRKIIKRATETFEKNLYSSDKVKFAISGRISHLPHTSKLVLSTAAFLGSSNFDIKTMAWLLKDRKLRDDDVSDDASVGSTESASTFMSAMMTSFRSSVNGLSMNGDPESDIRGILMGLEKIGMVDRVDMGQYRFAHDRVQQAAYTLIPEGPARNSKHWKTGNYLKRLLDKRILEDDWLFFTMIDQLNRGSSCVTDEEESLELSALNLRAAYKAKERSAFTAAVQYAHYGIGYLDESSKWNRQLSLSLKLTNLAAEMALSCGDVISCLEATEEIIETDELDLQDKITAYFFKIKVLVQQNEAATAVKTAISVLAQLGEKFAAKPSIVSVVKSLANVKGVVKTKPGDDEWLDMDYMNDQTKLTTMRLLALSAYAASSDKSTKDHIAPFRSRMFQLAARNGRCEESVLAYTGYGILVATTLSDYAEAYRFGSLGLQLQQLENSAKYEARVAFEFYAYTHHLKEPIRHSLVPLQQSFKKGLRYGTIQDALVAASVHCSHYLCSGRPLAQLSRIFDDCLSLMSEYTPALYLSMVPYGQLVKNLMGESPNSKVLNGDVMDAEEIMMQIKSTNDTTAFRSVLFAQIELACWYMQYRTAHRLLKEVAKFGSDIDFNARFPARRLVFYEGIIQLGLARETEKAIHVKNARGCAKKMQKYVQQGAVDCLELFEILEAELLSFNKKAKPMEVTRAYQKAITTCVASRAHQNIGLSNELAGRYQKSIGDETTAMLFLEQAHLSYTEWNAFEKAQQLVANFPELEGEGQSVSFAPDILTMGSGHSNLSSMEFDATNDGALGPNTSNSSKGLKSSLRMEQQPSSLPPQGEIVTKVALMARV